MSEHWIERLSAPTPPEPKPEIMSTDEMIATIRRAMAEIDRLEARVVELESYVEKLKQTVWSDKR